MKKQIIAHRGASNLAHENTVAAFQKAIELGADMAEMDIRRSKDGELVVYHYEILKGRLIRRSNYREILKLSAGTIPTLKEVLALTAGKIKLDIELKEGGYEKAVLDLVLKYFKPEDFIITSFKAPVVLNIKKYYPQIKAGLLIEPIFWQIYNSFRYFEARYFFDSRTNRKQAVAAADFLALNYKIFDSGFMDKSMCAGKSCCVFTVNAENKILRYFKEEKIFGVITNHPDLALKLRGGYGTK